ncbi:chaperonin 10-like protein [Coniella lustricola]|uniref:Chaperonin 10-like protein n=1 Tax=Coniella lustricola TaxID=2025994 RepID=A0A2T3ALV9_9PEZI|nr:chaperonin 10-like protein [Coniella lustricola]
MASTDLPAKYKAAIYDEPGKISTKVVELDMPEPASGDVLIKLTHTGVCGSDLGLMTNRWRHMPVPTAAGQVGGHEGIGHVVKLGPGTENSGVKVGDRVGIKWLAGICGSCQPCLNGYDAACERQKISGFYWPGTFQQYVTSPANYVTPIPDEVSSEAVAPLLCAGVTAYSALRKTNLKSGQWVVLMGAGGGLGHLATQIAARGIGLRVIGIDSGSKRELVLESGAEHFLDFSSKDIVKEVTEITGGLGAHAVVVLTNANGAYAAAIDLVRVGGTITCVGIPEGDMLPIANAFPQILIGKSLKIIGVAVGNRQEAIETLDLAARGIIKTHYVVDKLENLTQIFQNMHDGKLNGRVVLDLQ